MLTITPTAATVLTKTRSDKGAPDNFGVRFFATKESESDPARLAFRFVQSPHADDTILDEKDIDAYVAPDVDKLIGQVIIDAEPDEGSMGRLVVRRAPRQD